MNLDESTIDGERLHGDLADRAQHYEESERQAAIYAATHPARETPVLHDGERVCLGCADPISPARVKACPSAVRCIECQAIEDVRKRRFGHGN
jgi:DnaK suppressor protein